MRRAAYVLICLLLAPGLWAASPFTLDHEGLLWKGSSADEGLVLTGEHNGQVLVTSLVPYVVGINGSEDRDIQVAADDLTGKVVVTWQRHYAEGFSQIMLAVWKDGSWERVAALTNELSLDPRFPLTKLSRIDTTYQQAVPGQDDPVPVVVRDSYLHIVWWEGNGQAQHGSYALLRLTATPEDTDGLILRNLDSFIPVGATCETEPSEAAIQHPLFADNAGAQRALVFFGSRQICLFHLMEVSFSLEPPQTGDPADPPMIQQRRRHVPVFGVRREFKPPAQFDMQDTRMLMGGNLQPVAYKVQGEQILFVTATETGWSPVRTLPVRNGLTLDQAIPLVENLAR